MTRPVNGSESSRPSNSEPVHQKKPETPSTKAGSEGKSREQWELRRPQASARTPGARRSDPPPDRGPPSPSRSPLDGSGQRPVKRGARQIESELSQLGVEWEGLRPYSVDSAEATPERSSFGLAIVLPVERIASELADLPFGALRLLRTKTGESWLALRGLDGVKLAQAGTAEAKALELAHRAQADLSFLGVPVELSAKGLRITGYPSALSLASKVDLQRGDILPVDIDAARSGKLLDGISLTSLRGGTRAFPKDHPLTEASHDALRQRVGGTMIPKGHWLESANVP